MRMHLISYIALSAALCCPAAAAFAQDAPATQEADPDSCRSSLPESATANPENEDEIYVTGSRIRGVAPVGSDIITLSREDMEATSAVSTAEIFRTVPQILTASANESVVGPQGGGTNITFATSVNLRGIGATSTLMLVNGRRVVLVGRSAAFKDPSVIPLLTLGRVEVVADGSSAIYGCDAIAGVVNLIVRRDVDGLEATARYGRADDYWTRQAGIAVGKSGTPDRSCWRSSTAGAPR